MDERFKTVTYLLPIIVVFTSLGVYSNALLADFVMDDHYLILDNYYIKNFRHIPEYFLSNVLSFLDVQTSFYRPLVHLIWTLWYYMFGSTAWAFHLLNVLFHSGVCLLVFFITRRLMDTAAHSTTAHISAFVVAMLFAVHPIHVEPVTWVAAGMDVFFTFFYLLAFYLYLRSGTADGRLQGGHYLSALAFFLALLCKEPALTFPIVLVLYDCIFRREWLRSGQWPKTYGLYLMALGIYLALRTAALGGFAPVRTATGLTVYQYALNSIVLLAQYLEKLLLPVNLNNWHVFKPIDSVLTTRGLVSLFIVACYSLLIVWGHSRMRLAALGLWLILIPLSPALYIPALTQGVENAFTERYLYLPSFGYVVFLGALADWIWRNRSRKATALAVAMAAVLGLYGLGTVNRTRVWRNSWSLWSDAVRKSPESPGPYNALGDALRMENRLEEAVDYYKLGVKIRPQSPVILANLGVSYAKLGQLDQAIAHLQKAIQILPGYAEAHNNLAIAYAETGHIDLAIQHFQTAVKLNPRMASAHNNLGQLLNNLGELDKAVEHYKNALRIDPDYADAHTNLGIAYGEKGRIDLAIEHFQAALRLNPNDAVTLQNLANAYRLNGMNEKAEEYLRRARALRGHSPERR